MMSYLLFAILVGFSAYTVFGFSVPGITPGKVTDKIPVGMTSKLSPEMLKAFESLPKGVNPEIIFPCFVNTTCYLGDDMFWKLDKCIENAKQEDIDMCIEFYQTRGLELLTTNHYDWRTEYCCLPEEEKRCAMVGLIKEIKEKKIACAHMTGDCKIYEEMSRCAIEIFAENFKTGDCDAGAPVDLRNAKSSIMMG